MAQLLSNWLVSEEAFSDALKVCRELIEAGSMRWLVRAGGDVTPRLDEDELRRKLLDEQERTTFRRILQREIEPALESALDGQTRPPRFGHATEEVEADEEGKATWLGRVEIVGSEFCTAELRQRLLVRTTARNETLDGLRWYIAVKKHDMHVGPLSVPFATIELELQPPGEAKPHFLKDILGTPHRRHVSFDCHVEDLDLLIEDLKVLSENLHQLGDIEK